jgi:hypothetical protein
MKKLITLITIIGLALSIGTNMAVNAAGGNEWDDVPDIYLPVRTR